MKEVVQQGVSVVSVDFAELGRRAVRRILDPAGEGSADGELEALEPTRFIARRSL
jgi:DNA-binding LacI/PurR family transcriptional regulator